MKVFSINEQENQAISSLPRGLRSCAIRQAPFREGAQQILCHLEAYFEITFYWNSVAHIRVLLIKTIYSFEFEKRNILKMKYKYSQVSFVCLY